MYLISTPTDWNNFVLNYSVHEQASDESVKQTDLQSSLQSLREITFGEIKSVWFVLKCVVLT